MPCLVPFFLFRQCKNYWNRLRFDRLAVTCTLLLFRNHGKNIYFWFFQVRCAHKSGDVINFIIVACRISSQLKWYKNCKNRLRLAKVVVKNKMSRFFMVHCVVIVIIRSLNVVSLWCRRWWQLMKRRHHRSRPWRGASRWSIFSSRWLIWIWNSSCREPKSTLPTHTALCRSQSACR